MLFRSTPESEDNCATMAAHELIDYCGNEFVTGSTKKEIHVEICSKCHPFYTGQQKATSARGRIDKFNRKYGLKSE